MFQHKVQQNVRPAYVLCKHKFCCHKNEVNLKLPIIALKTNFKRNVKFPKLLQSVVEVF